MQAVENTAAMNKAIRLICCRFAFSANLRIFMEKKGGEGK
jgi:hypothetical protein